MSNRRTIFDIYRSKDFSKKPSGDAWNRLEKKLDEKPIHRGLFFWNRFSIAATFLVLIAMAGMAGWYFRHLNATPQFASLYSPAQMVEDFEYLEDYKAYAVERAILQEYKNAFQQIYESIQPENAAYAEADTGTDEPGSQEELLNAAPNEPLAFAKRSLLEKPAGFGSQNFPIAANLQNDFSWLKGTWEGEYQGNTYVTDWSMPDSETMVGKGYVLEGDDTLFKEPIALKQIGDRVYLFQTFDQANNPVQHEMTFVNSDSQWMFASEKTRILLEKAGPENYQLQYKPVGTDVIKQKELLQTPMKKQSKG